MWLIQSNTVYLYVYEGFVFGIRQSMHVAGRELGNERVFRTGMLYWLNQFFLELDTYNFIILYLLDKTINLIFFKFELFRSDYFIKTIIYTELITSCSEVNWTNITQIPIYIVHHHIHMKAYHSIKVKLMKFRLPKTCHSRC